MRLRELEARFLKIDEPGRTRHEVDTLAEAQGVIFLCPLCWTTNAGPIGTHSVICWFRDRGVLDTESPSPGRWDPGGAGLDDLTFVSIDGRQCSVQLLGGCNWHGHIVNGEAIGGY